MDMIKPEITMNDLEKIDIRVGTIKLVEDIAESNSLLILARLSVLFLWE